jgi:hypothetical protein
MVGAGAERFLGRGFVLYQRLTGRCGSETKGYSLFNEINGLSPVLTTFDDF